MTRADLTLAGLLFTLFFGIVSLLTPPKRKKHNRTKTSESRYRPPTR